MRKAANVAIGIVVGSVVAYAIVHRRVIVAIVKGEPLPELPESHKKWHPCANK